MKGRGVARSGVEEIAGQEGTRAGFLAPIHRAGRPFIAGFLAVSLLLGLLWEPLFWLGLVATAWCAYFFRDPRRVTPLGVGLVTSPADGIVAAVAPRVPPRELDLGPEPRPCIGIFMNVFDVHINRTPLPGRIVKRAYHPGKFLNASLDKASELNERQSWLVRAETGAAAPADVALVQVAGLVARRILPFASEGQVLAAGERLGLIRFGSRCDVYLPQGTAPLVVTGQRMVAGETVLAQIGENGQPRRGIAS